MPRNLSLLGLAIALVNLPLGLASPTSERNFTVARGPEPAHGDLVERDPITWSLAVYPNDHCDGSDPFAYIQGSGTQGCTDLKDLGDYGFDFDWNSFEVTKDATYDVVLFRGRDCPYTEDDPFYYDCTANVCLVGYGTNVPMSFLVTDRGGRPCSN